MRTISVIIPVFNSEAMLTVCLQHLARSAAHPLEIIVVDDGSTDGSIAAAREGGARIVSNFQRQGPARARNLGAKEAVGDVLLFLDADVCVYPSTLSTVISAFEEDPELTALIGSYDDSPASPDFLSQYRNLMHCFVHQTGKSEASTFWSGCGAIRRPIFWELSGFDENYSRPAIEDIELGYRLIRKQYKITLDADLKVKHLKRWTFWNLVKTDILDRGIPWTELIMRDRHLPNDLNLQLSQRVSVALVFVLFGGAALCTIQWRGYFLVPLFAALFFLLARYWLDGSRAKPKWAMALMSAGVGILAVLARMHHMLGIIPPVLLGYTMLFVRHRYAAPEGSAGRWNRIAIGLVIVLCFLMVLAFLPANPLILGLFATLAVLIVLNNQFYLFLAEKNGRLFTLAAIPFHLLYHFYNGISFAVGVCRHAAGTLSRKNTAAQVPPPH